MKEEKIVKILKKIKFFNILLTIFFVFSIFLNAESIKNYDVTVTINKDATLTVKEKIDYEFDGMRHGIYHDISLASKEKIDNLYKPYVKMLSVTRNGMKEKYRSQNFFDGVRYAIGDGFEEITGSNKYEIEYKIYNMVLRRRDAYQIYFNVIGKFWQMPIEKANVTIKMYDGEVIKEEEIAKFDVYSGEFGDSSNDYEVVKNFGKITINSTNQFDISNGITFWLNLKTDKIAPTDFDTLKMLLVTNPVLVIGPALVILLIIYAFFSWAFFGKDPVKRAIVPEFNPPKDMSSMFVAYINGTRDPKEIINIGVLSLISKGFIKAVDKEGDGKNIEYLISRGKNREELFKEEKMLLETFFIEKNDTFQESEKLYIISNKILNYFSEIHEKVVYQKNLGFLMPFILSVTLIVLMAVIGNGFLQDVGFDENIFFAFIVLTFGIVIVEILISSVKIGSKIVFAVLAVVGVAIMIKSVVYSSIILMVLLIIFLIYSKLIGKYTNDIIKKKEYIKGMKLYLKTAEDSQIKKFNDVDEMANYFKRILPFAAALGILDDAIKLMQKSISLYGYEADYSYIVQKSHMSSYDNLSLRAKLYNRYNRGQEKIFQRNRSKF